MCALVAFVLIVFSGQARGEEVTKQESFTFYGTTPWVAKPKSGTGTISSYCGCTYGSGSVSFNVTNTSIPNFANVDFSSVTNASVKITVKGLTNKGTNEYTVTLVNSEGEEIGEAVTKTDGLGKGSNSSAAKNSSVILTPVPGATGYRIKMLPKGAIDATSYVLTYTTATETVTVTSAGFATYCSENALDFSGKTIQAFVGTLEGTSLTFSPINQVPANTGVLLYAGGATQDITEEIPIITSAPAVEDNCLEGVNEATTITASDYILSPGSGAGDGVGFYRAGSHTSLAAHRAYIPALTAGRVKGFAMRLNNADGIEDLDVDLNLNLDLDHNAEIYNLAGQRVSKAQKGLYIINGKKVMVK